jgi:hypothetical protein
MNKYKIGDRVRVINGIGKLQDAMRGRVGTVAAVHEIYGVQHCWVLIDGFDNPHKVDPTIAFHYNQLAPWLNDSKDAKELAMSRYLKYKNNGYKKEVAKYCYNDVIATEAVFNATRTTQTVIPKIKDVIYNDPATIVFWEDGTKTVVKCEFSKRFDPEKGLAMAFSKKMFGNKGNYYNVFKKWLPDEKPNTAVPICHEIQNMCAINADKISKIKFECFACAYGMMFERGFYCICPEPCVNGDKWRHKK